MWATRSLLAARFAAFVARVALAPVAFFSLDRFPHRKLGAAILLHNVGALLLHGNWSWETAILASAFLLKEYDDIVFGFIWMPLSLHRKGLYVTFAYLEHFLLSIGRLVLCDFVCWLQFFPLWAISSFVLPFLSYCQDAAADDDFISAITEAERRFFCFLGIRLGLWLFFQILPLLGRDWILILLPSGGVLYGWMTAEEEGRKLLLAYYRRRLKTLRAFLPRFVLLLLQKKFLAQVEMWEQDNRRQIRSNNSGLELYTYEQLDSKERHFRLLKIHRTGLMAELHCSLERYPLDNSPPYEALSYTWGEIDIPLRINNRRIDVGEKVDNFIWRQRSWLRAKYVWIDSICINQRDQDETSHQVRIMQDIYARAARIVGWLDSRPNHEDFVYLWPFLQIAARDKARAVMEWQRDQQKGGTADHWRSAAMRQRLEAATEISQQELDDAYYILDHDLVLALSILRDLFNNRYFERIWIVQEVAMGKTVHMRYGDMCFNWDTIEAAADFLTSHKSLYGLLHSGANSPDTFRTGQGASRRAFNALKIGNIRARKRNPSDGSWGSSGLRLHPERKSVLTLLMDTAEGFFATDDRDKIFAIFALAEDSKPSSNFADLITYHSSANTIYVETAKIIVKTRFWPWLLKFAGRGYDASESDPADRTTSINPLSRIQSPLPSWVPDWSHRKRGIISHAFSSDMKVFPAVEGTSLTLSGHMICRVQHIGPSTPLDYERREFTAGFDPMQYIVTGVLDWYCTSRYLARRYADRNRYGNSDIDSEFWRVCMASAKSLDKDQLDNARKALEDYIFAYEPGGDPSLRLTFLRNFNLRDMPTWMDGGGFSEAVSGTAFAVLMSGRMALVPPLTQVEDHVFWATGALTPYVVRPKAETAFELIGSCYVHREDFEALKRTSIESQIRLV